ncbi:MBOAT family O-acyltransferase [Butyrivibrio sp. AE2015]|uniref:MBOAT family O-acyltransferase n=1 Tax=Butyrivibrio sp. AE2015 TaxID=1280663 RepID=UPI0003B2F65B|nr:MBOAT family protein [Butyrivibrio sp. AE2015]
MLFSSTTFIYIFLPTVIIIYYGFLRKNRQFQNVFLFVASLMFYAWGEPKFVFVMMASIVINWLFGLIIQKERGKRLSKIALVLDIFVNLFLLFVFKYLSFSLSILQNLSKTDLHIISIELPIGISFFTFQAMSYVIDVYRQNGKAQTNLLNVGLYISFFPQLIAGPIVRYETVANEIQSRVETSDDFFDGFARFVIGLSKKVLLANNFAVLADQAFDSVKNTGSVSALFGWLGAIAYTLQIYYDFSGYSDMAIGLGKMFGFHYKENFNYPYISTSVTEFWRRWHMSLGTWFRDYLYIPLGGNRCSKRRNVFNLFIVWTLTGLWHGANFTFLVWGLMYFVLLIVEKNTGILNVKGRLVYILKWIYTSFFVIIGWIIFRSDSLSETFIYLKNIFLLNGNSLSDGIFHGWFTQSIALLCIGVIFCTPIARLMVLKVKENKTAKMFEVIVLCCLFVLSLASLIGSSYNPFIYFNF